MRRPRLSLAIAYKKYRTSKGPRIVAVLLPSRGQPSDPPPAPEPPSASACWFMFEVSLDLNAGQGATVFATRKPSRPSQSPALALVRLAARRFPGRSVQEPPRTTRLPQLPDVQAEPSDGAPR